VAISRLRKLSNRKKEFNHYGDVKYERFLN